MEAQIQGRDHNFSLATRVSIYILAKRLAGKSFFEMTYLVSSGTLNFKPINQSINQIKIGQLNVHDLKDVKLRE